LVGRQTQKGTIFSSAKPDITGSKWQIRLVGLAHNAIIVKLPELENNVFQKVLRLEDYPKKKYLIMRLTKDCYFPHILSLFYVALSLLLNHLLPLPKGKCQVAVVRCSFVWPYYVLAQEESS